MTEIFIDDKLESLKKYTTLSIERQNVVLFNKTSDSLEEFVEKILKGNAHVVENINDKLEEFGN